MVGGRRSSGSRRRVMENHMISESCRRQLAGFGLTTAHILYRRPDRPWLLQSYVWQEYDTWPDFPILRDFLAFWRKSLDGALHSLVLPPHSLNRPPATPSGANFL